VRCVEPADHTSFDIAIRGTEFAVTTLDAAECSSIDAFVVDNLIDWMFIVVLYDQFYCG
jgi:hypothetical protein